MSPVSAGNRATAVTLGYRAPLLAGEAGTNQTIKLMRKLVDQALADQNFVRQAIEIVRSVPAYDEQGEANALYNWVQRNIRFTKDPLTKEKLYPPQELLKIRAGDCDDISMLLGAMLLALGYPARLVTIAANAQAPDEFSHVYVEAEIPPGSNNWVPMDAARYGAQFGVAPPIYYRKRAWSLTDDSYQDLSGMTRLRGLSGYAQVRRRGRGLGDDSSDGIDWSSIITQGIQQVPQDIAVAEGQSTALKSPYGTVTTTAPYASFATPYTPGYGVPAAGYSLQGNVTSSSWLLPALGILALIMFSRRSG